MEFGKGGVLFSLGTPSGKGYWTLSVSFSISLSVCLPHGKTEGPGRWQGVNPWDVSPKQIWRSTLDLHLAIAPPQPRFSTTHSYRSNPLRASSFPGRVAQNYC